MLCCCGYYRRRNRRRAATGTGCQINLSGDRQWINERSTMVAMDDKYVYVEDSGRVYGRQTKVGRKR